MDLLEELGEPVPAEEEYWPAPQLRESTAASIAIGRYIDHLGSTRDGPPELQAVVDAEIERLREEGDVRLFAR